MGRGTDRDLSKVAEENPYWGVLSVDEFRGMALSAERKARFYSYGATYFSHMLGFVRKHTVPDFTVHQGLDFGYGVGRLLVPLARVADEAVGVDVAPKSANILRILAVNLGSGAQGHTRATQ